MGFVDTLLGHITDRTSAAKVPFVLVFVPSRASAAIVATDNEFGGIDPIALGDAIGEIARRRGAEYIDMSELMGSSDDLASEYFPADGHPSGPGHAVIARAVVQSLLNKVPPFSTCRSPPTIAADQRAE